MKFIYGNVSNFNFAYSTINLIGLTAHRQSPDLLLVVNATSPKQTQLEKEWKKNELQTTQSKTQILLTKLWNRLIWVQFIEISLLNTDTIFSISIWYTPYLHSVVPPICALLMIQFQLVQNLFFFVFYEFYHFVLFINTNGLSHFHIDVATTTKTNESNIVPQQQHFNHTQSTKVQNNGVKLLTSSRFRRKLSVWNAIWWKFFVVCCFL